MKSLFFLFFVVFLGSCASKPHYYWGSYEELIYKSFNEPDKITLGKQIEKMNADLAKSKDKGLPIHPGFHAYLGFLHYQAGDAEIARQQFKLEKDKFPESEVLMNRFLGKAKK